MTPDLRRVRRKLAALRAMVEGGMPVKTRWLALRLIDSSCTALGPELPTPEQIETDYLNATDPHFNVIPFPQKPSQMIRHLYFDIPGVPEEQ